MARITQRPTRARLAIPGLATALMAAGCASPHATLVAPPADLLPPPAMLAALPDKHGPIQLTGPLTLDQALAFAYERHPELQAAAALVGEAEGKLLQAGFYPNPTVGYSGEQMGSDGTAGQQAPFVEQTLVTGGKLRLDQAMAAQEVSALQWQAVGRRFDLQARVQAAYYEALAAQMALTETEGVVKLAEENLAASKKLEQAGRGSAPNVLRAQVELETNRNLLVASQRRVEAAWSLLANALGAPELPKAPLAGDLAGKPANLPLADLQAIVLTRNSELMAAQAEQARAAEQLARAHAENIPNLDVQLQPLYDFTESRVQATVQVGAKLPVWNQNQGNILAAEAEIRRRASETEAIRLRLNERLVGAHQRHAVALAQAERFEKEILPQAREALRLSKVAFESGDARFDYTSLLDAQRTLAQARLAHVQTLGDLWKAAAELDGLKQMPPASPNPTVGRQPSP